MLCAAAGIDHAGLIRDPDLPLGAAAGSLAVHAARRLRREPVSRILGHRAFWGLSFTVTPAVLDPRPETEGLVDSVLDSIGGRRGAALAILDLGTGTGAILAALLRDLPLARGLGIDRSFEACRIARRNLLDLGLGERAALVCGDWATALRGRFDIVVSNPPYIATGDLAGLERDVREHDPIAALDGGPDGLDAYRAIAPRLGDRLWPGGVAAFECGAGQGPDVATLLRDGGLAGPSIYLDLAGHDRVVIGVKPA